LQADSVEITAATEGLGTQNVDELERIEQEARMLLAKVQKQKHAVVRQARREKKGKRKRMQREVCATYYEKT
jgi:hypothetical protein